MEPRGLFGWSERGTRQFSAPRQARGTAERASDHLDRLRALSSDSAAVRTAARLLRDRAPGAPDDTGELEGQTALF